MFAIFEHILDCRRNCDGLIGCQICSFVEFTKTGNYRLFEDILIDERDLREEFLEVFKGKSLLSLGLTKLYGYWIDTCTHKVHVFFYLLVFGNQGKHLFIF